ncbi:MAG: response regulator [Lachnospiraceae bacterium]|nr:response regulator [Lachnospiraceae bacterium]
MYRIFLADDEVWEMKGMKKIIQQMGLPLLVDGEAEDGIAAWEGLRQKHPDILLADIRMPGFTGLELVQKMRQEGMNTKVIFISGYAEFSYAQKALRMGVSEYLIKPVEEEELREILEELVRELEGERQEQEAPQAKKDKNVKSSVIQNIIQEIENCYSGNITLKSLADKYYISDSRLSVQLKEQLGMSFPNYLASLRIQKAKELMEDENLSLEAVAKMVGFKDYFYFNKVFKKMEGISPSKFRKKFHISE